MGQPQPVGAPPFTVEEAVALAIRQNPHLSAAAREVVAARAGVRAARALANPALIFAPAITSAGGSDEELLFQQPLELNGTRAARTGVARANLRVAQAQAIVELRNLVAATKTAYYELARAQEQRSLAVDLLQIAEEIDRITRRQVELGSRAGIEQTQTAIEVARARQQVVLAESQVASARAALNLLLGQTGPDAVGMGLLSPLTFTSEPVDEEAAIRQALAARAEIAGEEASRDAFRHGARLARAEGRPDLAPQLRAESVTRGLNNAGLGIAVTLPLFDYGSRRYRIRQAEEASRAQADRIVATRNQVRQEVEQALARLKAAEAVLREYQQGVLDQARRLLAASRTGFQAGATSVLAVLEAQRTYRAVQSEYIDALVAHAQARAELERATGAVSPARLPAMEPEARRSP